MVFSFTHIHVLVSHNRLSIQLLLLHLIYHYLLMKVPCFHFYLPTNQNVSWFFLFWLSFLSSPALAFFLKSSELGVCFRSFVYLSLKFSNKIPLLGTCGVRGQIWVCVHISSIKSSKTTYSCTFDLQFVVFIRSIFNLSTRVSCKWLPFCEINLFPVICFDQAFNPFYMSFQSTSRTVSKLLLFYCFCTEWIWIDIFLLLERCLGVYLFIKEDTQTIKFKFLVCFRYF